MLYLLLVTDLLMVGRYVDVQIDDMVRSHCLYLQTHSNLNPNHLRLSNCDVSPSSKLRFLSVSSIRITKSPL